MLYPLYDYYKLSCLTLDEIIDDYLKKFYLRRHSQNESEKVRKKVLDSPKIAAIDAYSIQKKVVPSADDFGSAINATFWFMIKSNSTQALAVLIAAKEWNKRTNSKYHLGNDKTIRDNALEVFKKYNIYEEMSQKQYDKMTQTNTNKNTTTNTTTNNTKNTKHPPPKKQRQHPLSPL